MIERYEFGLMLIDGKEYKSDIILKPKEILSKEWFREEGHELRVIDVKDYLDEEDKFVVIGTGDGGEMQVPEVTKEFFKGKNLQIFVGETPKAVEEYNRLEKEGRDVVGFFHLTC